jgi:hypothetical protein
MAQHEREQGIMEQRLTAPKPIKRVTPKRTKTLPFREKINRAALKTLERRGITLKDLQDLQSGKKRPKGPTFVEIMMNGYREHAAKLAAAELSAAEDVKAA